MTATTTTRPRIVVGVDGSPDSEAALRWAARLAKSEDAQIAVVTAWQYPTNYGWVALPLDSSLKHDLQKVTEATIDGVLGNERPDDLTVTTVEGHPATVLLDAAKGARMLVVGSRGLGGFASVLLGSVSHKVAEHADCPVLVVH